MLCNSQLFRPMQFLFQNSTSVHLSDINTHNIFFQPFQAIHANFQLLQYCSLAYSLSTNEFQLSASLGNAVQLPILPILHFSLQVFQQCSQCIWAFRFFRQFIPHFCLSSNAFKFISAFSIHTHFLQKMQFSSYYYYSSSSSVRFSVDYYFCILSATDTIQISNCSAF